MGINYNIQTWISSLRKMCIVSVAQNILETARHDPSTMDNPKSIASKAAEMVSELDLPQTLNTEIVAIIRPVMEELLGWYQRYGDAARAILTPYGTVDMARSARAIVASNLPVYQRYVTACDHCLEDDIFTLGKQVTSVMLQERSNPLANFWYDAYGGNFNVKIFGGSLSREQVVEGCILAGRHRNISAVRYFLKRATPKSIQVIMNRSYDYWHGHAEYLSLTLELCITCLNDNVFNCEWLEKRKDTISTCLLLQLIKWPYQHLFQESAELLMPNLSEHDFWHIACSISEKLFADCKEYDYGSFFVRFWNLGLTRFKSMLLDDTENFIESLLVNISMVKDEFLVSLVFDQISQMDEDYLNDYFPFKLFYVCVNLFSDKANESIEFLMKVIRAKYRELFLKFQNLFNTQFNGHDELDPLLTNYVQFMSKCCVLSEI